MSQSARLVAIRAGFGWFAWFAFSLAPWLGASGCAASRFRATESSSLPGVASYPRGEALQQTDEIAVIGDVQRTAWFERFPMLREDNHDEQQRLLADLAKQRFAALVLLGDLAFSARDENWTYFDSLMAPLRRGHAESSELAEAGEHPTWFFPVLGNHDYMGSAAQVEREFGSRFPGVLGRTHYSFVWHHVRMIVLDGNRSRLCTSPGLSARPCASEWQAQLDWLRAELHDVDVAPPGQGYGALLFVHQSPYTQSPIVAGDQTDARDFAQALFESDRGLALISAHAHGFERYCYKRDPADARQPKAFVVSAGGGGPRPHWPRRGAPADLSQLAWPRPFNYLLLTQNTHGVQVEVHGLDKGASTVQTLAREAMALPFR